MSGAQQEMTRRSRKPKHSLKGQRQHENQTWQGRGTVQTGPLRPLRSACAGRAGVKEAASACRAPRTGRRPGPGRTHPPRSHRLRHGEARGQPLPALRLFLQWAGGGAATRARVSLQGPAPSPLLPGADTESVRRSTRHSWTDGCAPNGRRTNSRGATWDPAPSVMRGLRSAERRGGSGRRTGRLGAPWHAWTAGTEAPRGPHSGGTGGSHGR